MPELSLQGWVDGVDGKILVESLESFSKKKKKNFPQGQQIKYFPNSLNDFKIIVIIIIIVITLKASDLISRNMTTFLSNL